MTQALTTHPIRTAGPLGTPTDFEMALEYAKEGATVSCTGLSDDVEVALDKVRDTAPNPPQNLIDAARKAFDRMTEKG